MNYPQFTCFSDEAKKDLMYAFCRGMLISIALGETDKTLAYSKGFLLLMPNYGKRSVKKRRQK